MKNRDKRILDIIRQAGKTDSVEKEIALINRESLRYDDGCSWNNTTVHPGSVPINDHFRVEWAGRDQIGGSEVVSIERQKVVLRNSDGLFQISFRGSPNDKT